jgi:hypothetical protein
MCGVASATDALGNESALPTAGTACNTGALVGASDFALPGAFPTNTHIAFAVDIAAPTESFSGGLAANSRLSGGTVGGEFQVTVVDNGTIGNSGMQTANAVIGTVQVHAQGLVPPSAASCFIGAFGGGVCAPTSVNTAPVFPLVPTTAGRPGSGTATGVTGSTTVGYYFYRSYPQDAAGNQGAEVTRVIAYDPAANVPGLTTAIYNIPLTGNTVVFNANASDNFDLRDDQYSLTYAAGALPGPDFPVLFPATVLNTFPASTIVPGSFTLVNSNVPAGFTTTSFMRQIEPVTSAGCAGAACKTAGAMTVGGAFKPTVLNGVVRDQANNLSAVATTPIAGAQVTTGVSYTAAAAAQLTRDFRISNAATSVSSNGANGCAAGTPTAATTVTLNADATGPTATYNPPFTRVDFYVVVNGYNRLIGSATTPTTTDDGQPNGHQHRYSFTWTPGGNLGGVLGKILTPPGADPANVCAGAQTLFAIGVNAAGDALATPTTALITLVNP